MNKEIKFEYLFENIKEDGRSVVKQTWSLKEIEQNEIVYDKDILIARRQYTGLKDSNRKEVYEHDILNHPKYGKLKVEWDYRNTGWCCISKNYKKYNLSEILMMGAIVVSNIHENPELLE